MALYSNLNLFFIHLFTRLVPRWLHAPFALFWGGLFYLLLADKRRGIRANLRVVTGQQDVETLVLSTFYKFSRNWCDVMLMIRLRGSRLQALIGHFQQHRGMSSAWLGGGGVCRLTWTAVS